MSILIKGMAMPKNCFDCEIFGLCSLRDRLTHIEDRNPDCPLVEIPTPHGQQRLEFIKQSDKKGD